MARLETLGDQVKNDVVQLKLRSINIAHACQQNHTISQRVKQRGVILFLLFIDYVFTLPFKGVQLGLQTAGAMSQQISERRAHDIYRVRVGGP